MTKENSFKENIVSVCKFLSKTIVGLTMSLPSVFFSTNEIKST